MTAPSFVELKTLPAKAGVGGEFLRYFGCSAAALAADFGLFSLGLRLGLGYAVAAAAGFVLGLWVAYQLSVRFAFRKRTLKDERMEFIIFAGIGMLGLLLTELLLWLLIGRAGLPALPARLATAGVVFLFNFAARKVVLFSR